ncbi:unnamed protein product [Peronospora belbahrii]|uniref:J domain-containing protein n=1 Tax=Peronospora belbahrii TaxID=622444 RepID=A0AAU9LBD2_9STRA|nr:unnamed protein product [Peronospora belbahrii]
MQYETRGAILPSDARTLRNQLHDSTSGHWKDVEIRLQELVLQWNPYQYGRRRNEEEEEEEEEEALNKKNQKEKLNFYQILAFEHLSHPQTQIPTYAHVTSDDIKRQFRKLALVYHPDRQQKWKKDAQAGERRSLRTDKKKEKEKHKEMDSMQFARLRLAYETLSDPKRRAAYDEKLLEALQPKKLQHMDHMVKDQVKLEASTDFASLEWMARVKHKMDVMERIAEWTKLLSLDATEIRFETGEPCSGKGCGKIVSMDRDLECSGSPRRRVYVCLLHKYIHACDESCTSLFSDAELDRRVCPMRAYWLIQNWLFDQLQAATTQQQQQIEQPFTPGANRNECRQPLLKKEKHANECDHSSARKEETTIPVMCKIKPSEIYLGDQYTRFQVEKSAECQSDTCRMNFQFLEDGIYACRRHGTPHICTFEQCDRQELRLGSYICWVSGKVYGREREQVGTDVRKRRVVYSDEQGDDNFVEIEVPVMLPLGKTTGFLLEGDSSFQHSSDMSSLSPPPPDEKLWSKRPRAGSDRCTYGTSSPSRKVRKRFKCDRDGKTSPARKRLHERLASKIERAETASFHIYLKLPPAVAILPKVALELEGTADSSYDGGISTEAGSDGSKENLLQILLHSYHTVNYIKYWMEELTEQQLSVWDQQIYWGDTPIGEEADVMVLEEHGISAGCILELRLHDDCPLLISKEAEEELDDLQEEWENVIVAEEEAFEQSRLELVREKLKLRGVIGHTEVLRYDSAKSAPRLLGVIQERSTGDDDIDGKHRRQLIPPSADGNGICEKETALLPPRSDILVKEEQEQVPKGVEEMRSLSNDAQPVKRVKKAWANRENK